MQRTGPSQGLLWTSLTRAVYHLQFQDVLNSRNWGGIYTGAEFVLVDLLALRVGYFRQRITDYGYPEVNKDVLPNVTYGLGLIIPLHKWTGGSVPIIVNFDLTRLPQPSYVHYRSYWGDFTSLGVRIEWTRR